MTRSKPTQPAIELVQLPFQVRPIAGEGRESFIDRLAEANCLKPRYLRRTLREPPWHRGELQWDRIATVTGCDADELRDILGHGRCKECGSTMSITRSTQRRTCSGACRTKNYRRNRPKPQKPDRRRLVTCAHCERRLSVGASERRRYYSHACREAAYRERRREREAIPIVTCEACQTPIGRFPNRRWCSKRCSGWAWQKSMGLSSLPFPGAPHPDQSLGCLECGIPIEPGQGGRLRKYCSNTCVARAYRRRKKQAATAPQTLRSPVESPE
ncbi:hypothetical protein GCM10027160_17510 [Streptomyces calidiresistens]